MNNRNYLSRRAFLSFVASSPLALGLSSCVTSEQVLSAPDDLADGVVDAPELTGLELDDLINVFDLQVAAEQALPPAHYGYLATGVDGDETLRANRAGFQRFDLRARRLVDVSTIDMSVQLLGQKWDTPIILAPIGSLKAFHADGERASARASSAAGYHQILSTVATTSIEDVNAARDRPAWYQLYPTSNWDVTRALIGRAEAAGCEALVLTVDLPVGSNRETLKRAIARDSRDCTACHAGPPSDDELMNMPNGWLDRKPMFDGLALRAAEFETPSLTWEFVERLKDSTNMKVLVKGIVRDDDAQNCVRVGADGIIVSNHGGRADASGRSTIESLPEIVGAVQGRLPVIIDSGFRRGTDILKALALGADAVCVGRPYVWGLAAYGEEGVAKALEILNDELKLAMQLHGVATLAELNSSFVTAS